MLKIVTIYPILDKLNKGDKYPFIVDEGNINEGYPILFWQSNNENVIKQYNENSSLYARQDTSKSNEDNTNKIEESDEYTNEYISMDKDAISKESYNNSEYSNKEHTIRTLIVVCLFVLIISILMIFIIYKN